MPVFVHNSNGLKGRLSDLLPLHLSKKLVGAYEDIRAGNGHPQPDRATGLQDVSQREAAHEKRWAPWNTVLAPRVKELKFGENSPRWSTVMRWTNDHYNTVEPRSAPHFPDAGW
jgi:hypothetical protein